MTSASSHRQYAFGTGTSVCPKAWMTLYSRSTLCAVLERSLPGGFFRRTYRCLSAPVIWYVGFDWPKLNYSTYFVSLMFYLVVGARLACFRSNGVLISGTFWLRYRSKDGTSIGWRTSPAIVYSVVALTIYR